jgi:hypothetical protein
MRGIWLSACLLAVCACSEGSNGADGGINPKQDGGQVTVPAYDVVELAPATALEPFSMQLGPLGQVGVAYFHSLGERADAGIVDGGHIIDFEVRYLEWNDGQLSAPERVQTVQRVYGVSLGFQPSGQPAVAYLGGDGLDTTGQSPFWFQSDAALSRRQAGGTWTEEIVARMGDEAIAGNPVSDRGFVVGLSPALGFSGGTTFLAWRDAHDGQFPQQDWNGSDLEVAVGSLGSWQKTVVMAGGDDKQAYGGHIRMVVADGQPALVSDQMFNTGTGTGQNLLFNRRGSDGTWSRVRPVNSVGNTQSGPWLAHDPVVGFGIAYIDRTEDALYFLTSQEGSTWTLPDPVFQTGSGGWYPSLSFHPSTHEPSIAFYVCSRVAGAAEGSCPTADDELRVSERIGPNWREHRVDPEGAWRPQLAHRPDGRRVIVYRHPSTGALKLAVER